MAGTGLEQGHSIFELTENPHDPAAPERVAGTVLGCSWSLVFQAGEAAFLERCDD